MISKITTDVSEWIYDTYRKYMIVNFYFIKAIDDIYQNTNSDYVLLSEDDQTYPKDTFLRIVKLTKNSNHKRIFSKISWCPYKWCKLRGNKRFTVDCQKDFVWGAWGALRSRKEMRMFLKWLKFSRMSESEDTLSHFLCESLNGEVEVDEISIHFGRDKNIPK